MTMDLNCKSILCSLIFLVSLMFLQCSIFLSVFSRYHLDPSGTFIRYEAKAIGKINMLLLVEVNSSDDS